MKSWSDERERRLLAEKRLRIALSGLRAIERRPGTKMVYLVAYNALAAIRARGKGVGR